MAHSGTKTSTEAACLSCFFRRSWDFLHFSSQKSTAPSPNIFWQGALVGSGRWIAAATVAAAAEWLGVEVAAAAAVDFDESFAVRLAGSVEVVAGSEKTSDATEPLAAAAYAIAAATAVSVGSAAESVGWVVANAVGSAVSAVEFAENAASTVALARTNKQRTDQLAKLKCHFQPFDDTNKSSWCFQPFPKLLVNCTNESFSNRNVQKGPKQWKVNEDIIDITQKHQKIPSKWASSNPSSDCCWTCCPCCCRRNLTEVPLSAEVFLRPQTTKPKPKKSQNCQPPPKKTMRFLSACENLFVGRVFATRF